MSIWIRIQRHFWLSLGLIAMSAVGTAATNHYLVRKNYQSSALVMVIPGRHLSSLAEGTQFTETFATLAQSQPVLELTQTLLPTPMSLASIQQNVVTAQVPNTDLFEITATSHNAAKAATLANALAHSLTVKLDALMGFPIITVAAPAIPAPSPFAPQYFKSEILAVLLSLMAAFLVAAIRESLYTALSSEADVERWTDLVVLGLVPQYQGSHRKPRRLSSDQQSSLAHISESLS